MQRVDFYVLPGTDARERLKFACRLTEKAYLAGGRVLVWLADPTALKEFDDLLWTFADRSFVPHEILQDPQQWQETPVLLSCERVPADRCDVLVNLAPTVPPASESAARMIEIIDAEPERRNAGRARFRLYRERGTEPVTHNMAEDSGEVPIK
jgi:DNA polymerase-3 subunit chi